VVGSDSQCSRQYPVAYFGRSNSNKDNKEEEYDGCWRMTGKVALAPAKRRGGAIVSCFAFGGGGTPSWMLVSNGGIR
jgi:hypothetical protein